MTRNRGPRVPLVRPRTALTVLLTLLGLTAVIIGILAMHVWTGGHGSTSHHVAGPATGGNVTVGSVTVGSVTAESVTVGSATQVGPPAPSGHVHGYDVLPVLEAATAVIAAPSDPGMLAACGADCMVEMALGACMLAMIVVGLAAFLTPAGRALVSTIVRRGPPVVHRSSRPAPAPSLIRLCISRI